MQRSTACYTGQSNNIVRQVAVMRNGRKIAACFGATCLACAVVVFLQIGPFIASRKINDMDWHRTAPPKEQRETAHEALGLWFGDPHDAFIVLLLHGDQSSIPYLQKALVFAPEPPGLEMCTWRHGRDALARLTSAN